MFGIISSSKVSYSISLSRLFRYVSVFLLSLIFLSLVFEILRSFKILFSSLTILKLGCAYKLKSCTELLYTESSLRTFSFCAFWFSSNQLRTSVCYSLNIKFFYEWKLVEESSISVAIFDRRNLLSVKVLGSRFEFKNLTRYSNSYLERSGFVSYWYRHIFFIMLFLDSVLSGL